MKIRNPFKDLTKFETGLWISSLILITASFLLTPDKDYLSLCASLLGATALIFVAKGYVFGQVLCVIFASLYALISFYFQYYGEMITYMCMSAPIAVLSVISWLKNPFKGTHEVEVCRRLSKKLKIILYITAPVVTVIFYFILKALGNANLIFSTLSVTTSWTASYLLLFRSPYYAIAYSLNDIVLIVLWVTAAIKEPYCAPMILCFVTFLANDLYGFYNWEKMKKRQKSALNPDNC